MSEGADITPVELFVTRDREIVLVGNVRDMPANLSWPGDQIWIEKLDAEGRLLWHRRYRGPYLTAYQGVWASRAIMVDDGFVIAGGVWGTTTPYENLGRLFVVKMDLSGRISWQREIATPDYSSGVAGLAADTDGNLFLLSSVQPNLDRDYQMWWLRLNPQGEVVSERRMQWEYPVYGGDLVRGSQGDFFVAGSTFGLDPGSAILLRVTPDGDIVWGREVDFAGGIRNIFPAPDGGVAIVAGWGSLRRFDAAGELLWSRQFWDGTPRRPEGIETHYEGLRVVRSSGGLWILTGFEFPHDDRHSQTPVIAAYDDDGHLQWSWRAGRTYTSVGSVLVRPFDPCSEDDDHFILALGLEDESHPPGIPYHAYVDLWHRKMPETEAVNCARNIPGGIVQGYGPDKDEPLTIQTTTTLSPTGPAMFDPVPDEFEQRIVCRADPVVTFPADDPDLFPLCLEPPRLPSLDAGPGRLSRCHDDLACPRCVAGFGMDPGPPVNPEWRAEIYRALSRLELGAPRDPGSIRGGLARVLTALRRAPEGRFYTWKMLDEIDQPIGGGGPDFPLCLRYPWRRIFLPLLNRIDMDLAFGEAGQLRRGEEAIELPGLLGVDLRGRNAECMPEVDFLPGLPGPLEDHVPLWPVFGVQLHDSCASGEARELKVALSFEGFLGAEPAEAIRLLHWDGRRYRDVTTRVDARAGKVHGIVPAEGIFLPVLRLRQ